MLVGLALKIIKTLLNLLMEMLNLIQTECVTCSQEHFDVGNVNVPLLN